VKKLAHRLFAMVTIAFIVGSGLSGGLFVKPAAAAGCSPPSIMFGRWTSCGYFYNAFESSGPAVRVEPSGFVGVPNSVNNANDFINMVVGDYFSGDQHLYTEGAFTMRVMTGQGLPTPPFPYHSSKNVSPAVITDFTNRVRSYANLSENGNQSFGTNGRIDWWVPDIERCGDHNSLYQVNNWDISPFIINSTNTPNCNQASSTSFFIIFRDNAGNPLIRIRRPCMNPFGTITPLAAHIPDWNLTPSVTATVDGGPPTNGAEVGQTIVFTYGISNSGGDPSPAVNCNTYANTFAGDSVPPSPSTSGPPGPAVNCAGGFGNGFTTLTTETIVPAVENQTICRSLVVDPTSVSTGQRPAEQCVRIVARPFFSVSGGDVSAGNGFFVGASCTGDNNAGIKSWNRDNNPVNAYGGGNAGLGAFVTQNDGISHFVSGSEATLATFTAAQGHLLSFANYNGAGYVAPTTYGDSFGTFNDLPCIHDYQADTPVGSRTPKGASIPNPNSLAAGSYQGNPGMKIGNGTDVTMTGGKRVVIYVDGDIYIKSNIFYSYTQVSDIPMLVLVAKGGGIYVDASVHELHGVFISQKNGGVGGIFATCATNPGVATSDYSTCHSQLRVVGAVAAEGQLLLGRTYGSLLPHPVMPTPTPAEMFEYSPELWLNTALGLTPVTLTYQAFTGLPPVL
jgi:hypothetical protein